MDPIKKKKPSPLVPLDPNLVSLLKRLDCERLDGASLVAWEGADVNWYLVHVEVAGLLQRELEVNRIKALLLEAGIRRNEDVVGAVRRLLARIRL